MHKKKKERTHAHTTSHLLHSYMMALTVSRRILCIFACVPESIYLWHNVISYILNISPTNGHPTYRKHCNYIITKAIKSIRAKRKKSLCYVLCNYLSVADSSEKSVCDTMIASCFCAKKKKECSLNTSQSESLPIYKDIDIPSFENTQWQRASQRRLRF